MKLKSYISSFVLTISTLVISRAQNDTHNLSFDFFGDTINLQIENKLLIRFEETLSQASIQEFYEKVNSTAYSSVIDELIKYKDQKKLDDWLYYQLIRKTAQQISPKAENYYRYTLYKWFFLVKSGYDAFLTICNDKILFYVQSDENIYNIPYRIKHNKQYVCLNYHDYGGNIDFANEQFTELVFPVSGTQKAFSYKVSQLPGFTSADYEEKDIRFNYYKDSYDFKIKLNPQVKTIFANYPVVDYESYFNIPLSRETYQSLIPSLKTSLKGLNKKNGVDFLMRFTRYAFLFEPDSKNFGGEKRLTPEQTLLYEHSDCEDRAALFFYLVKEIYDLPMIVLTFPEHVTIAVKFDKPVGNTIVYNGNKYSVCEPTPQKEDLALGQLPSRLRKASFDIVYEYNPQRK